MANRKPKPVYSVTAFSEVAPTATYSCLKTLCQEWKVITHYSTIWKWLRENDLPYDDGHLLIKKHILIKSKYTRKE